MKLSLTISTTAVSYPASLSEMYRFLPSAVLVPDRDAAGAKMLESAKANNWSVSLPPWGDDIKDVADAVAKYGRVYVLQSILHYRFKGTVRIELLKKQLEKLSK